MVFVQHGLKQVISFHPFYLYPFPYTRVSMTVDTISIQKIENISSGAIIRC